MCQKDGWKSQHRSNGSAFKNQGDCVSYAATGGTFGFGCKTTGVGHDFLQTGPLNTSPNGDFYNSNDGTCSGSGSEGTLVQAATVGAAETTCDALFAARGLTSDAAVAAGGTFPDGYWFCQFSN